MRNLFGRNMNHPEKLISKESLSKMYFGQWIVCLNNEKFQFCLKPCARISGGDLEIKSLSLKHLRRFGDDSDTMKYDESEDAEFLFLCIKSILNFLVCVFCNRYITGFCYKHPLIFVKENVPSNMPYNDSETLPEFLYLAKSTIPGAGKGVFTNIDLPAGVAFGPYSGELLSGRSSEMTGYSWQLLYDKKQQLSVDAGSKKYSNWMRFANCPRVESEQNMVGIVYNQNVYYYTFKPVPAETELMVWYGRDYAENLRIPGADKVYGSKAPKKKEHCKIYRF